MRKCSTDLTKGNIARVVLTFAFPIFVGQIFQNLYNSVDSIVVGRYVGTTALAAVSSCGNISQLLVGFFVGLSAGASVLFARYFGAKNYPVLEKAIHTATIFSLALGGAMAVAGILLTPQLLRLVQCPKNVWGEAEIYLRIYFVGIMFTSVYNICSGVLQAVGDSKNPLKILMISSVLNILLDQLFVVTLKMGVAGVGLATILSQGISVLIIVRLMLVTNDVFRIRLTKLRIDWQELKKILQLGLPSAIQSSLISISNIFIQRYINGFGSAAMAGIGAGQKIDRFSGLMAQSIGLASTTFVSQNIGAGKLKRTIRGINICLLLSIVSALVFAIPTYLFAFPLVRLFTADSDAIAFAVDMIHLMLPFFAFNALQQIFSGVLRGFGYSRSVMVMSLIGMVGFRQLYLALTLGVEHRIFYLYMSFPVGWISAALLVVVEYIIYIYIPYKKGKIASDIVKG